MQNFNYIKNSRSKLKVFVIFGFAIIASLITGIFVALLPPVIFVSLYLIPIIFFTAVAWPVAGLIAVMLVAYGLVPAFIALPFGGATLRLHEMMLLVVFLAFIFKVLLSKTHSFLEALKPVTLPFTIFSIAIIIAFVNGRVLVKNEFALADLRQLLAWLALPIATWCATTQPRAFIRVIVFLGIAASILMLTQTLTGMHLITGNRGSEELSSAFSDVTRSSIGGGIILLVFCVFYAFANSAIDKHKRFYWTSIVLLIVGGLIVSFSRGVWLGVIVAALPFLFKLRKQGISLAPTLFIIGFLLVSVTTTLFMTQSRLGSAITDRFASVGDEGGRGSSVGFRFDENSQAWDAIKKSPVLGSGLGFEYKKALRNAGRGFMNEVSFVHNGYLALWLKFGLLGLIFPFILLWILSRVLHNSTRHYKPGNAEVISAFFAIVAMSVYSVSSPEWNQFGDVLSAAVLTGLILGRQLTLTKEEHHTLVKDGN